MAYDLKQASVTGPRDEIFMLVHGSAGVGKTTLAAAIPNCFFIRTEDGTGVHEVPTYPIATTYDEIMEQLVSFDSSHSYKALVIDSIDHLEPLIWQKTCSENGWKDIEAPGYGKGYIAAMVYWRQIISLLNKIREAKKMHIVLIAHNELKPFRDPELEPVDAYFIKLQKHASAFVKESCDAVLYAKQKIVVVKDSEGFNKTRARGKTTGVRVLMTQPHPGYEAKNRYGLPAELPLEWNSLIEAIKQPKKEEQAHA
jgi:hypothetical protein